MALRALLSSRRFVKAEMVLAKAGDWAAISTAPGPGGTALLNSSSATLLAVVDKLLAAAATNLVTCHESCGAASTCAPCCRGPWDVARAKGGGVAGAVVAPSLIVREVVAMRRRLGDGTGRWTQLCWSTNGSRAANG